MNKLIQFNNIKRGQETMHKIIDNLTKKFSDVIKELVNNQKNNHEYCLEEIDDIANRIIEQIPYYCKDDATPIVKIAQEFDFKTYKKEMKPNISGDIRVNGDTKEKYGHNRVILVNSLDNIKHIRFVIAHELAHFLFNFLGNEKYTDKNILYSELYCRDTHDTMSEIIANRFAAAILMPKEAFLKQYSIALKESNDMQLVVEYLSEFFEVKTSSVIKRIQEVVI